MAHSLDDTLVVGISSRALFDLDEADAVFRAHGLAAYRAYQRAHENEPLGPGAAFRLVRGMLALNQRSPERLVEVVVMSRNDADSAMRVFNSIEAAGLDIGRGAFRGGRDPWPYLTAFRCNLFLSAEPHDVYRALGQGFPAALVLEPPDVVDEEESDEVRIAFDGDAVLFDDRSERIYQERGLGAFQVHEAERAHVPLSPGPFRPFLEALARIQARFPEGASPIRTALVTARGAPAHRRVVTTLRAWNVRIDETFFLGGLDKTDVLKVLRPHIFFDDQMRHLERAATVVPAAHVLPAVEQLALFPAEPTAARRRPPRAGARVAAASGARVAAARPARSGAGPAATAVSRPSTLPATAPTPARGDGPAPASGRDVEPGAEDGAEPSGGARDAVRRFAEVGRARDRA
jgi:5'-nucleotidase